MKSKTIPLIMFLISVTLILAACTSPRPAATPTPPGTGPDQEPSPTPPPSPTGDPAPTAAPIAEPTAIPASEPTAPPATGAAPTDWDGVLAWLAAGWQANPTAVLPPITALDEAGWIDTSLVQVGGNYVEFMPVDLSGDTVPEWIVTLHPPDTAPFSTPRGERRPGNMVIIGEEGILFQVIPGAPPADQPAPAYIGATDFTGDGISEVVIETLTCGANTCYGKYTIMSYHRGYLDDLAAAEMQDKANPQTSIAVEVDEPVRTFYLEYTDGSNLTGIRRRAEWAWVDGAFALTSLVAIDDRLPADLTELESWLTGFYLDMDTQRAAAQDWLYAGGWMSGLMEVVATDMDGDGENEWIVPYHLPGIAVQEIPNFHPVQPGGLWVLNSDGVVHKAEDHLQFVPGSPKEARSVGILDMTGDGRLDIIVEGLACGTDYCSGSYELVSGHRGSVRDLLGGGHPLNVSSRINPTAIIVQPGELQINYQAGDGVQGLENWLWDSAELTLINLTGSP